MNLFIQRWHFVAITSLMLLFFKRELNPYINGGRIATVDSIMPYPTPTTGTEFGPVASGSGAQVFPGLKLKPLPKKR